MTAIPLNESTTAALRDYLEDYQGSESPMRDGKIRDIERALASPSPLTDERFAEYFVRLEGPEGCDFRENPEKPGSSTWNCGGGMDKSKSTAILAAMGLDEDAINAVHRIVNVFGGHCDCEILFNAAEKILPVYGAEEEEDEMSEKTTLQSVVIVQKWEESERGWGTRPDGYSLHLSEEDRAEFIKTYWDSMPAATPAEYSRPDGTPYEAEVDEGVLGELKEKKVLGLHGLRFYNNSYPGSGGTDGWIPRPREGDDNL